MRAISLLFLIGTAVLQVNAADPVFDLDSILATPLDPRVLKTTEHDGIVTEEVMFRSETDNGTNVDIFAYFEYPKGAAGLPAFIWNQSGLYQAGTYFTTLGAKRGYAAMCIDFPIPGYRSTGLYPINSGMNLDGDPKKAPIYHGAVALLKAVSFLESRKEVNKDKIGMCGASWGGFYTTLMAGVDPRLKAASAMHGTGSIQLGNNWWFGNGATPSAEVIKHWRTTLDPALRLPKSRAAMSWVIATDDHFFWIPAVMATYEAAPAPKNLTLMPNWDHGVPPELDEQVFAWLDVHLKGAPEFISVTPVRMENANGELCATWTFKGPRTVTNAYAIISYGKPGNWQSRYWITIPASISNNVCKATLPKSGRQCYVGGTVKDTDGFRYSTTVIFLDPQTLGFKDTKLPSYNGCADWGSFEPEQVTFLKGLAHMNPTISPDAHEGKQALVVKERTVMKPLYFTAGAPHRFTCFVKADKDADGELVIEGTFDGKHETASIAFKADSTWKEVSLDFQPREMMAGNLQAVITPAAGSSLLIDSVAFRPKD